MNELYFECKNIEDTNDKINDLLNVNEKSIKKKNSIINNKSVEIKNNKKNNPENKNNKINKSQIINESKRKMETKNKMINSNEIINKNNKDIKKENIIKFILNDDFCEESTGKKDDFLTYKNINLNYFVFRIILKI